MTVRHRTQTTISKVVIGIAILVALGPLCYGFSAFDADTTIPWWQGAIAFAIAIATFAVGGFLSRAMGREVIADADTLRTRGPRGDIVIRWSDAPRIEITASPWARGTRVVRARVHDRDAREIVFETVEVVGVGARSDPHGHALLAYVRQRASAAA
ncbi:MAG: hypothetical protein M3Y87_12390 [Myxococcota bacterium]|nr:hypothetical protein [Myxococcota bacterium]